MEKKDAKQLSLKQIKDISYNCYTKISAYAQSPSSKHKPWYKRTDLSGLCKIASLWLKKDLQEQGMTSKLVKGYFDIEAAGGNGKGKNSLIQHYWIEIDNQKDRWVLDITNKQFMKYLNTNSPSLPPTPLIVKHGTKHANAYLKSIKKQKKLTPSID